MGGIGGIGRGGIGLRAVAVAVAWCAGGLGAALPAAAQGLGNGFGAGAWSAARPYALAVSSGVSHWQTDCGLALVCDRNAAGLRVTGAWVFRPGLSLEASYVDEGQVKARRWLVEEQALQTTRLRVRGAGLGVAWWVPLDSRWWGVLRAGAAYHHVRFDENLDAASTLPALRETRSSWDPALGLGVSYRLSARWQLDGRLDWTDTRLRPPPSSLIGGGTVAAHQWGVGLTYGF